MSLTWARNGARASNLRAKFVHNGSSIVNLSARLEAGHFNVFAVAEAADDKSAVGSEVDRFEAGSCSRTRFEVEIPN
jgi:chemotaxis receptor (MCP) glutamine deamidase CheD